jgi:hypothetical protein
MGDFKTGNNSSQTGDFKHVKYSPQNGGLRGKNTNGGLISYRIFD